MPEFTSFADLTQQVFEYHGKPETQQAAYDLMTKAVPNFPEQANLLYNWRYCAAALLGMPDLALGIMQEALDAGFWWGEDYLRSDTDLASLQDLPEFNRLVAISEARHREAEAAASPLVLTLPLPVTATEPLPLLLALHGNSSNAQAAVKYWESAVDRGWLSALLQSSQVIGPDAYVWNDLDLGASEIKTHYQDLSGKHHVDPDSVVISGFSKGGEMAIWLALKEIIPLAGFIAVNPGGPFIQDINNWLPILEECKSKENLRGFFLVGERDANLEKIKALCQLLLDHGLACELHISTGIAHDFPQDFDQILAGALDFAGKH